MSTTNPGGGDAAPKPKRHTRYTFAVDATDLINEPNSEPQIIIDGVLRWGEKMMLGGTSKSNKTWTLLDLAVAVASGTHWLGFKCVRSRVIYVNLELPHWSIRGRIKAIRQAKEVSLAWGDLEFWNMRGTVVKYETLLDDLAVATKSEHCGLVIVDPIYKVLNGADENAAGDIGKLMNKLEKIVVESKAAVVFAAHYAKGNSASKDPIDRVSGSGVFVRDPDSVINMTPHREEGSWTINTILRNSAPIEPFVVSWKYPLMTRNELLDPNELKKAARGGSASSSNGATLLGRLGKRRLSTTLWAKECREEDGISRSRFFVLLAKLRDAGHIAKGDDGCWESTLED